ncbi:hypothetical protein K490DRAFT_42748 [Saccharata proteae CBS 121410]|uniref:CENP-V/GFA domain-containing protein n=1 Tax=Saccharata proteae CBS 121410 TaxID=1314787 RepID=A0A9P4HSF3_9PEZI|nr:hypothetical protein K490DRAFT_42748 [Saccharata proteae CBS 121410]
MTTTGGCQCGNIKYSYSGDPAAVAICHCIPCRRSSNSLYSTNLIVPEDKFESSGAEPKTWSRVGDSGKKVINSFCPECGTLCFVRAEAMPGSVLVKAGTVEELDKLNGLKPAVELYKRNKFEWMPEFEGVKGFEGSMA